MLKKAADFFDPADQQIVRLGAGVARLTRSSAGRQMGPDGKLSVGCRLKMKPFR